MATIDKLKVRLPGFITQNQILDDLLGVIADAIDDLANMTDSLKANFTVEKASGFHLDGLARDMGLFRAEGEGDRLLRVFLKNGQEIYRRRGSKTGIEDEIARLCKASAFLHFKEFTLGDSYLLPADEQNDALGSDLLSTSILIHNVTELTEVEIKALVESIVPVHVKYGVETIDISGVQDASYKRQVGADFSGGETLSGVEVLSGVLVPKDVTGVFVSTAMDLGSGCSGYYWAIDWLEYRLYERLINLVIEARFTRNLSGGWTAWQTYEKNDIIPSDVIVQPSGILNRYMQYRLKLALGYHRVDRCLYYAGSAGSYTDYTDEANFDDHVPVDGMTTQDYLYVGMGGERFAGLQIDIGSNPNANTATLAVEYWNGYSWVSAGATDRTVATGKTLAQDGLISWPWPIDWDRCLINGERLYWVRLKVSSNLSVTVDLDGIDVPDIGVDDWALERLVMKGFTEKQY